MPTIIDSLLMTLGLDPKDMKKGADEAGKIQDKLEDDHKKSNKRMSDDDKKREKEQERQRKLDEKRAREMADSLRKVRNETIALLGLFTGGMGLKNFITSTIDQAAGLKFLRENLDMSVESIQAYQRASERMGGTAEGAVAQLKESQAAIAQLRTGQGPSASMQATFRAAGMAGEGLSEDDLRTGNTYLLARSRIIASLYKQNAANAALMAAQMGISEEQFNLLKQGPEAVQKLIDAQKKNSVINEETSNQALILKNRWLDFTDSTKATGTKILVTLIPAFKELLKWLQGISDYVLAHRKEITDWISATIPKVIKLAEEFGKFIKNTNFEGLIASAKALLDIVVAIAGGISSFGSFLGESAAATVIGAKNVKEKASNVISNVSSFLGVGAGTAAQRNTNINSSSTTKSDVKIGQVVVNTQATDAAGIARSIGGELNRYAYVPQAATGMR